MEVYLPVLYNSFGLFQYLFWNLILLLPYFIIIMLFISLFLYIFNFKK